MTDDEIADFERSAWLEAKDRVLTGELDYDMELDAFVAGACWANSLKR